MGIGAKYFDGNNCLLQKAPQVFGRKTHHIRQFEKVYGMRTIITNVKADYCLMSQLLLNILPNVTLPPYPSFFVHFKHTFVTHPAKIFHFSITVTPPLRDTACHSPKILNVHQLNFTVFCASSASCGVSSVHLNYAKHPMIRSVYRFHVYYHVRQVLKRLQIPLPHESSFNASDNPYTSSEFFKICEDYGVPNDPMQYMDEKFYWTYQRGIGCSNDYLGSDSMTQWIIEKSVGFTGVGLYRISESARVRAYAYLILSSQASARSSIVANMASALTAQSAFLNKFENVVNHRVNIQGDIKHYQDTLSYTSSKVNYSRGKNLCVA